MWGSGSVALNVFNVVYTAQFTILTQRKTRDLPPNAIVLSCDEDSAFFPEFVERGITAHTTEFLLTGVLRQELPGSEFVLDLSQSSKKKR